MNKIAEQNFDHLDRSLRDTHLLSKEEWMFLIENRTRDVSEYLFSQAREVRHQHYGHDVYIRGLIEFTNYCKNDCIYCGIRKSNLNACRYRLSETDIQNCCRTGIMNWAFAPLSFKAEKMAGLQIKKSSL